MKFHPLSLPGACLIELEPRGDARGRFVRLFCERELAQIGFTKRIVNVNSSFSAKKGTLRGMHFQKPPFSEIKIVRCTRGAVVDVIVDIRKNSDTFLKWEAVELTEDNDRMLLVPEGFAHGFQTTRDDTEFQYFVTQFYSPEYEAGLRYDDPALGIAWPLEPTEMSPRDREHPLIGPGYEGLDMRLGV